MSEKQKENTTMNDSVKEETADNQNISANSLDNIYNVHYEFTINEEYEQFSLFLFSIWNVERTTTYKTDKLRPNEPKIMYAFIRTLSGCGKIITKKNTYILTPNTLILLDVNDIVEYSSVETTWTYYWYNFTPITALPFFEQDKIYTLQTTYEEEHINKEMFEAAGVDVDSMMDFEGMKKGFDTLKEKIDSGEVKSNNDYSKLYDIVNDFECVEVNETNKTGLEQRQDAIVNEK